MKISSAKPLTFYTLARLIRATRQYYVTQEPKANAAVIGYHLTRTLDALGVDPLSASTIVTLAGEKALSSENLSKELIIQRRDRQLLKNIWALFILRQRISLTNEDLPEILPLPNDQHIHLRQEDKWIFGGQAIVPALVRPQRYSSVFDREFIGKLIILLSSTNRLLTSLLAGKMVFSLQLKIRCPLQKDPAQIQTLVISLSPLYAADKVFLRLQINYKDAIFTKNTTGEQVVPYQEINITGADIVSAEALPFNTIMEVKHLFMEIINASLHTGAALFDHTLVLHAKEQVFKPVVKIRYFSPPLKSVFPPSPSSYTIEIKKAGSRPEQRTFQLTS